ncbi:MAG TPA: VOC family protein [Micromonosporaceae bacterium]|jgi:predicted enzyme related to lactoylglutathione lyase
MEPIARLTAVVLDCPDPHKLASFYGELTGWAVEYDSEPEWVTLRSPTGLRLCFQEAADHVPPVWPDPSAPQQVHLDFSVPDLDEAEERVIALGAVKPDYQPGETWRVYADPAGHPFCLYEEG